MKARIKTAKVDVDNLSKNKLYEVYDITIYDAGETFFYVKDDYGKDFRCILKNDRVILGDWEFVYPSFVEAPESGEGSIVKGDILKVEDTNTTSFTGVTVNGKKLLCLWEDCSHIADKKWIERWDLQNWPNTVDQKYPKYVEAPCDSSNDSSASFTKGKVYRTYDCSGVTFKIADNQGIERLCLWQHCAHLDHCRGSWIKRWDLQQVTDATIRRINENVIASKKPKVGDYIKYHGTKSIAGTWYRWFGQFGVQPGDVGIINNVTNQGYYIKDIIRNVTSGTLSEEDFTVISDKEYDERYAIMVDRLNRLKDDETTSFLKALEGVVEQGMFKPTMPTFSELREMYPKTYRGLYDQIVSMPEPGIGIIDQIEFVDKYKDHFKSEGLKNRNKKQKSFKPSIIQDINVKLTVKL